MNAISSVFQMFSFAGLRRRSRLADARSAYGQAWTAHQDALKRNDTRDQFATRIALNNAINDLLTLERGA